MTYEFKFSGTRIIDDALQPTNWIAKIDLVAVDHSKEKTHTQLQADGNMAFQKMFYWMETCLHNVVMTDVNDEFGMFVAGNSNNMMLYSSGPPTDDILVQMLHAKLCAIVGAHLNIGKISLYSTDSVVTYTYEKAKTGYTLYKKVSDFVSMPSLHNTPWWFREDGFMFEFPKSKTDDTELEDIYMDIIDPLTVFTESLYPEVEPEYTSTKVEKWSPKIV